MENPKIFKCKITLDKNKYERDKIKTLYNWIKIDYINLQEYIFLTEWLFRDCNFENEF